MTNNQIQYWKLSEETRHNIATEGETYRHDVVTEGETNRHNLVTESISYDSLKENQRHNLAQEGISRANINLGYAQLDESKRHNIAQESVAYSTMVEQNRHNLAQESLTHETNQLKYDASIYGTDHSTALGWRQLSESERHNKASEANDQSRAALGWNQLDEQMYEYEDLAPYRKWESGTKSFKNITGGISDLMNPIKGLGALLAMGG